MSDDLIQELNQLAEPMNQYGLDRIGVVCRKAANEIKRLREAFACLTKKCDELVELNNNLASHRDELLADARDFCGQVSRLTQRLCKIEQQRDELLAALEELYYARTDKAEQMAEAVIAKVKGEK